MTPTTLPKGYEPQETEARWYPFWLKRRYFHADDKNDGRKSFSIVIPPPNVTGSLHMGHAFNMTLQDILTRTRRMQGYNTCWLPGTDHAGIATQNVVEKQLAQEGRDRHALGREAFVQRVLEWKKIYGERIVHQLQRLGASCDWDRQRFTMDDGLSRAVREVFVHLHQEGLIYRDTYLVNWCPRCHTALSDIEVDHEEMSGHLWHLRYPLVDNLHEGIVVVTTRPETMLGDTAVAVHPDDERYQGLVGKSLQLPLVGRTIPVIADHRVDRTFGTGAVKVTPAHDLNDFHLGSDHHLERINIFTPDAAINEAGGRFAGLDRYAARTAVLEALEQEGALVQTELHQHAVGHCYRCKTVVEPYLSLQWFVKTAPLAERAIQAVRQGKTRFFPRQWERTFFDWLERIQPWCISRQIWWGHRIPAWYCPNGTAANGAKQDGGEAITGGRCPPIVSRDAPKSCPTCGSTALTQDDDVLDTWFSSALWPFTTFGWPDQTMALKTFYPTTVLVTGFDIIFFWVARMMMLGLRFMGDVPFHHVYIHALVRDPLGQKMSKSKGNVIDPLEMMDRYGTDAFRFTLAAMAAQGRDVKLHEEQIGGYRNFCNKLWNAARFMDMQFGAERLDRDHSPDKADYSLADRWIQYQYQRVVYIVTRAIDAYEFDVAARTLYQFVWHEFCDWYLEAVKPVLQQTGSGERRAALHTLWHTFEGTLRLLHPFMPFITEELWQHLQRLCGGEASVDAEGEAREPKRSIVVAPWPTAAKRPVANRDVKAFDLLRNVISGIRMIRSQHQVAPAARVTAILRTEDTVVQKMLGVQSHYIRSLAKLDRFELRITRLREPGTAVTVVDHCEVAVPLAGVIDFAAEQERLSRAIAKAAGAIETLEKKLANAHFVERAPEEVVEADRQRLAQTEAELHKLQDAATHLL